MAVEQASCPLPVGKILAGMGGGALVKYLGHTQSWSRHWVGLSWKILRNFYPVKRYWVGGWVKKPSRIPSLWKGTGWGPRLKEIEVYPGLS